MGTGRRPAAGRGHRGSGHPAGQGHLVPGHQPGPISGMLRPGGLPTPAWADGDRAASGGWSWPPRIRAPCRTRPPGTWSPTWPDLGHAETWRAADASLGGWGPGGVRRLVVATADPGTLPDKATWYLVTNLARSRAC